eukprot:scaffold269_cov245-Chaetoceros_neogracile.AAC.19
MRSFQPFFLHVVHLVYYLFLGLDAFILPSIGIRPSRFITNDLHPQSSPYTINLGFASGTQLYQSSTPPTDKDLKELPPSQHSPSIDRANDKEVSSIKLDANGYRTGSLRAATAAYGRVPYGEESRKYRRTVFDYDDWVTHRNTEKIVTNLKGMFFSGVIRQLREEVLFVTLASALVVFWNDFLIFPDEFINGFMLPKLILPALPFTLSSPALGLLLVFKTNASYARWSEARTTWSKVVSHTRNMVRMTATFVEGGEGDKEKVEHLSNAAWLLTRSLMSDLLGPEDEENYREQVMSVYSQSEEQRDIALRIIESEDRTMASLAHASIALDNVPIDEKRRVEIDKSLVIVGDCIGVCQKIYSSPVPLVCKFFAASTDCQMIFWILSASIVGIEYIIRTFVTMTLTSS